MTAKPAHPPDIIDATTDYEKWLSHHVQLVGPEFKLKHLFMRQSVFAFLRATFYRWAQMWPLICPDLTSATRVLAVGDLHLDNFGTWRDIEGRLIWGINDFDEAWPAPYTLDLVRLVTSAYLAIEEQELKMTRKQASAAVEDGYRDAIASGGKPFVLAEHNRWLRLLALNKLRDPVVFWKKIDSASTYKGPLPKEVRKLLCESMPVREADPTWKSRVAGLGSLGHPRVLALATWNGGQIVREAKQLSPSGWVWAKRVASGEIFSQKLLDSAVRIKDPHVHFVGHWIVRRLAPDCCHIDIASLPRERDEERLLYSMGWETANVHLGSQRATPALKRDLGKRRNRWLHKASKVMLKTTLGDWKVWARNWDRIPTPRPNPAAK